MATWISLHVTEKRESRDAKPSTQQQNTDSAHSEQGIHEQRPCSLTIQFLSYFAMPKYFLLVKRFLTMIV